MFLGELFTLQISQIVLYPYQLAHGKAARLLVMSGILFQTAAQLSSENKKNTIKATKDRKALQKT